MEEITEYAKDIGIYKSDLQAAVKYAIWSADAEYRLLAAKVPT